MAKAIKFNLICDGERPVRTLEDLRMYATVEDLLTYYANGLLERWLAVRGYEKEREAVKKITETDPSALAKALVRVFNPDAGDEAVQKDLYILEYKLKAENAAARAEAAKASLEKQMKKYKEDYFSVIRDIVAHKDDMAKIKAAVAEIDTTYRPLFEMNYRRLWLTLSALAPMALFAMLMRDDMRNMYLPAVKDKNAVVQEDRYKSHSAFDELYYFEEAFEKDEVLIGQVSRLLALAGIQETRDTALCSQGVEDIGELYLLLRDSTNSEEKLRNILGSNLKEFAGKTDGYWKDLEERGKKFMILRIEDGDVVRAAGKKDGDLKAENVNGWFPIVDGIDYKSNSDTHKLLYLEV